MTDQFIGIFDAGIVRVRSWRLFGEDLATRRRVAIGLQSRAFDQRAGFLIPLGIGAFRRKGRIMLHGVRFAVVFTVHTPSTLLGHAQQWRRSFV